MNSYRYGFNGMEKDDEVKGGGNSFDFGSRMYDPRTGRWFTTDKNQNNYPAWSTYSGFGDNPIFNVDKDGNDFIFFAGAGYKGENEQKKFNKSFTSTMSEILGDNFSVVPFINNGALTDVAWGMKNGYTPIQNIDEDQVMLCAISHVEEVISGLECGEPLNMVGSSYGSATAAQTTFYLLEHASEYGLDNVQISLTLSSKMLAEDSPLIKALIAKASEKDSKFILVFQDFPEDNVNGLAGGSLLDKDLLPVIFPHIGSEGYQTSMLNPWGNHTHNEMAQSTAKTYDLVNLMLYTLKLEGLSTSEKAKTVLDRKKNTTIVNDKLDTKLESPSDNHGVPSF
jgi:RHS repeat-associated protein